MAEFVRSLAVGLRRLIGNRRRAVRYNARLPFSLSLAGLKPSVEGARRPAHLEGSTRDISATGLALILPAILLGEHHLAGEGRALLIKLELPSGPIELEAAAARYERLDETDSERGYIVGANITRVSDEDRARLDAYLDSLKEKR
ncbi:MAG TPA: PilZ domain-containing protein [Pyrinomonadaceae bacterium]|jgi:hypothetical protein